MGLEIVPEIKMARKLHKKHSLVVPIDLDKLVSDYAQVIYKTIPINGVDGVCLNLKNPKKSTKIVVNNSSSTNRQRFTLAHELGHIIIPWHLGTIIDDIDSQESKGTYDSQYWIHERQANRFASELLMPFDWLYDKFLENNNLEDLLSLTVSQCVVSEEAARIRISRFWNEAINYSLPSDLIQQEYAKSKDLERVNRFLTERSPFHPFYVAKRMTEYLNEKIAFCVEKDNKVIGCGSTNGTHLYYQTEGDNFNANPYPLFKNYQLFDFYGVKTHWWELDVNFSISEENGSWQEALDRIAMDLAPNEDISRFKSRINGRLSGLNGSWKKKHPERSLDDFIQEIMSRFNNAEDEHIFKHPDFSLFVRRKSMSFFNK